MARQWADAGDATLNANSEGRGGQRRTPSRSAIMFAGMEGRGFLTTVRHLIGPSGACLRIATATRDWYLKRVCEDDRVSERELSHVCLVAGFDVTSAHSPAYHHGPTGHAVVSVYVEPRTLHMGVAAICVTALPTTRHCRAVATGILGT